MIGVLNEDDWTARSDAHAARVDTLVGDHVARSRAGESHPVVDFLFTYYNLTPSQLRRWSPGFGVELEGASVSRFDGRTGWNVEEGTARVSDEYLDKRSGTVEFVTGLLAATASRPARSGCFGLHEWAMVYRADTADIRHDVPLRLGSRGTDEVVESMPVRCTHYDAFRFFTPDAVSLNSERLSPGDRADHEQPGCLHANMDLYKWCAKLGPLLPADLTADCFEAALRAREIDMRASPYDLTRFGYTPIAIETPSGRAEYVRAQQTVARDAAGLRQSLLDRCRQLQTYRVGRTSPTSG